MSRAAMIACLCLALLHPVVQAQQLPKGVIALDKPAPVLRLKDGSGKIVDLEVFRGKWVLVHFWAGWCAPCRRELPTIERMAERLVPDYLELILINTAETEDEVFAFMSSVAPNLVSLHDTDGSVTERWQPRGLPASFFVDPEGRIRYVALGGRPWDTPVYMRFLRGLKRKP